MVGIEGIRFEFLYQEHNVHHVEPGNNAIYFTNTAHSWVRDGDVVNGDSGVLTDVCSNVTIDDVGIYGRKAHYGVHMGDCYNVLAREVYAAAPVEHTFTFNAGSRMCVSTASTATDDPVLDQHSGLNYQNLFDDLTWITTHPYGIDERDHGNNHSAAWALQAAAFARLVGDDAVLADVRRRFKTVLVPEQMAADGSFPNELSRTKPYGYSLFVLDMFAATAQAASVPGDDLWTFETPDGRGLARALDYITPFVADKAAWPLAPDVEYWDDWPVRQPALLLGGMRWNDPRWCRSGPRRIPSRRRTR